LSVLSIVVRTDWFRDFATRKIVTAVEGTGGRAEIGSVQLDPVQLAVITDFVIHGYEPRARALLRARRVEVDVRVFTSLKHLWNIDYLGLEGPQANVM
jgi:hypothetical protein